MHELDSLDTIKGVGSELAAKFRTLGISSKADLIDYYPRRYDDYSQVTKIHDLKPGVVTIEAQISSAQGRYVRRGLHITEAVATDDSGSVRLVWFNQPYRAKAIRKDVAYYVSGEFGLHRQRMTMMNPSAELVSEFPINTARIIPIYRETKGLKSAMIRRVLRELMPEIRSLPETLPSWMLQQRQLVSFAEAIEQIHFPTDPTTLVTAKRRLGFEEVFELSLAALLNKYELLQDKAIAIPFDEMVAKTFVSQLPFTLTDPQRKAVWQIYKDMQKTQPMNRLLEGDVGSGKTVVAAMAALMALNAGFQTVYMAPTELLARQHAETIFELLKHTNFTDKIGLLIGSLPAKAKTLVHKKITDGSIAFVIGTQSLIQDKVKLQNLGLIIVDEQHRFGVEQRKKLQAKAGQMPHILHMTATPIPRSLALTLYGELDITIIDALPSGRIPIKTEIVSPNSRKQVYEKIDAQIAEGRQVFVVCPLINETDDTMFRSAEEVFKDLSTGAFKLRRIGLLHGKLKSADKEQIMAQFVAHELDILVSTTVIEVGVNVPNASVMLIESADRFGLAQMHQLRGRVGRGTYQAYCFLMMSDSRAPSARLRAIESSNDGFKLAEYDLELRGPGAIYGVFQHGQLDLRIAKLQDVALIKLARLSAQEFIDKGENLLHYEHMAGRVQKLRTVTNLN